MKGTVPQEITDGFAEHDITVRIWYFEDKPDAVGYFTIEGKDWEVRINSLAALYAYFNGFERALENYSEQTN